jgi:hypothetical protein
MRGWRRRLEAADHVASTVDLHAGCSCGAFIGALAGSRAAETQDGRKERSVLGVAPPVRLARDALAGHLQLVVSRLSSVSSARRAWRTKQGTRQQQR